MLSLAKTTLRGNIGVPILILCILIGGTWAAVKITIDYLLYQIATSVARDWARYLAEGATDLEQIVAGGQPSTASMLFFHAARKAGPVFRYQIFNREGYSKLTSDRDTNAFDYVSEFSSTAERVVQIRQQIVEVSSSIRRICLGFLRARTFLSSSIIG
jgi:hypothetical protein